MRMPEARGDIREIVGEPVFVPLQKLAAIYGKVGNETPCEAQFCRQENTHQLDILGC